MKQAPSLDYQCVIDTDGIQIWVHFKFRYETSQVEFHGMHEIDESSIEIIGVDLIIADKSVAVNKLLNEDQRDALVKLLSI